MKKRDREKNKVNNSSNGFEKEIEKASQEIKKEIILNVPNSITFARLVLTFLFIYLLFSKYPNYVLFLVFTVAAITDWFDGYFARKLKQTSKFGARLDQIVDRIFTILIVGAIIVYIIMQRGSFENIFQFSSDNVALLLFLSCSREIIGAPGVIIALIRKKPTYNVKYIGKVTTFVQSVTLAAIIINFPFTIIFALVTCIVGIFSGLDYLRYSLN